MAFVSGNINKLRIPLHYDYAKGRRSGVGDG